MQAHEWAAPKGGFSARREWMGKGNSLHQRQVSGVCMKSHTWFGSWWQAKEHPTMAVKMVPSKSSVIFSSYTPGL